MKMSRLLQALVIAAAAVGCGAKVTVDSGGAGTGTGGSDPSAGCDVKTTSSHVCTTDDFSNDTTGLLAAAEVTACKQANGTPGSCPSASALGVCTLASSAGTTTVTFYSDTSPALTLAQAQAACQSGGGTFQ